MTNFEIARLNMVESQVRPSDVTDRRILSAMADLPREEFLSAQNRSIAYMDRTIPITTSDDKPGSRFLPAPMIFAKLVQLCAIKPTDLVLEIGTSCGYGAAVLASLADSVVALESDSHLAGQATQALIDQGISNVAVVETPLQNGYASQGPYDVILLEGSVEAIPQELFSQLCPGGRLAAVIGTPKSGKAHIFINEGGTISQREVFDARMPALDGFEKDQGFVF